MAKFSTGLRNIVATDTGLADALSGCVLKLYAGTVPTSANSAIGSATLLGTYSGDGAANAGLEFESTPVDGAILKKAAQGWQCSSAAASGNATFYRLEAPGDSGAESSSAVRVQGTVGVVNADLNLTAGVAVTAGAPLQINTYILNIPEQA